METVSRNPREGAVLLLFLLCLVITILYHHPYRHLVVGKYLRLI